MTVVREQRDFAWWLNVVLAPVGFIGGPIAIADMFAGVIKWHGVLGFVVTFWDENVSRPFGDVLAAMCGWINVPRPPEYVADYLTLGILFFAGSIRARSLLLSRGYVQSRRYQGNPLIGLVLRLLQVLFVIAAWPLISFLFLVQVLMRGWDIWFGPIKIRDPETEQRALVSFVALAPFAIFLGLWVANTGWGIWAT